MIRKEADEQKVKLQKMKDDGKDEYDVRKMAEVLQEQSHVYIPFLKITLKIDLIVV